MKICCAINCNNNAKKNPGVSFHKFPKDSILRRKWILAVRRKDFEPTHTSHICSDHFTNDDFQVPLIGGKSILKDEVVPSIFDYSGNLRKFKSKKNQKHLVESQNNDLNLVSVKNESQDYPENSTSSEKQEEEIPTLNISNIISSVKNKIIENHQLPSYDVQIVKQEPLVLDHIQLSNSQETIYLASNFNAQQLEYADHSQFSNLHELTNLNKDQLSDSQDSMNLDEIEKDLLSDTEEDDCDENLAVPITIISLKNHQSSACNSTNIANTTFHNRNQTIPLSQHLLKMKEARKKIKVLQQKVRRQNKQILKLKERLGILLYHDELEDL